MTSAAQAGQIILNPAHGRPGTRVTFEGVGWDLAAAWAYPGGGGVVEAVCSVSGKPVKWDWRCEIKRTRSVGQHEPVGSFTVADVPPGTYPISVSATFYETRFTANTEFTVDSVATMTTVASTMTVSTTSYASSISTAQRSTPVVTTTTATVTTTEVETRETPRAPDYSVMSFALSIVAISLVAILAVLYFRRARWTRGSK